MAVSTGGQVSHSFSFMVPICICHLTGEHFPERTHSNLNITIICVLDGGPLGKRSGQRINDTSFFLFMK